MAKKKYQHSKQEIRQHFYAALKGIAKYWANETRQPDVLEKIEGAIFSTLVMLDGGTDWPSTDLVIHGFEDEEYAGGRVINDDCELHGEFGMYKNE